MGMINRPTDLTLSADGEPGVAGKDGKEFPPNSTPHMVGGPGENGAHGTSGGPGGNAGTIEVTLHSDAGGGIVLSGQRNGESVQIPWDPKKTNLLLSARGGDGGVGGSGAAGQKGATGFPGENATKYSMGTDGGPGGNGGHGGAAGSGGDAGSGGCINLRLDAQESDLLAAVNWDVSAGRPGSAGAPGKGGRGGSGGSGGSSYSWSELEHTYDGENYVSHSQSGGSKGMNGFDAPDGVAGKPGEPADEGSFRLEIDGVAYPGPWVLSFSDYVVAAADGTTGDHEVGERNARGSGLKVMNTGASPSPPQYVSCRFTGSKPFKEVSTGYPLPSIPPGETHSIPSFSFHLEEAPHQELPTQHSVLRHSFQIAPRLFSERLEMYVEANSAETTRYVTFPVELETVPTRTSLTPGETFQQSWKIHNRSGQPFPPPERNLELELSLEDRDGFLTVGGPTFNLSSTPTTYLRLPTIPPGGFQSVQVPLCVSADAPPYRKTTLVAGLKLTPPDGDTPRLIQVNPTEYSTALNYGGSNPDVLLIVNQSTVSDEVQNWLSLFHKLGLSHEVWDISLHGGLPLDQLSPRSHGKLIICLVNSLELPNRETASSVDFLDYEQFRRAVSRDGVSFYLVGEQNSVLEHLVPQPGDSREFGSPEEYMESLSGDLRANPEVPGAVTQYLDKIVLGAGDLDKLAHKMLADLEARYPQRRFLVVLDSKFVEGVGGSGRAYVRHLLDSDARAVVVGEVARKRMQTESFIHSEENLLGLFSAQDFDDKLEVLTKFNNDPGEFLDRFMGLVSKSLADAILLDLTEEQMTLRRSSAKFTDDILRQALNRTVDFCSQKFCKAAALEPDSPLGKTLLRVIAGMVFLAENNLAWWDHRIRILGGSNDIQVTKFIREEVDRFLDHHAGPDRLWGTKPLRTAVEKLIKERRQELGERAQEIRGTHEGTESKKGASTQALVRWDLRRNLSSDATGKSEVWSSGQMLDLLKKEESHEQRRVRILRICEEALSADREVVR